MLTVIAEVKAKEGKGDRTKELLRELAASVKANEPGTLAYSIYRRKDDERIFVVFEQYKDDAAFQAHLANLAKHAASFGDLIEGPPSTTFLEAI